MLGFPKHLIGLSKKQRTLNSVNFIEKRRRYKNMGQHYRNVFLICSEHADKKHQLNILHIRTKSFYSNTEGQQ